MAGGGIMQLVAYGQQNQDLRIMNDLNLAEEYIPIELGDFSGFNKTYNIIIPRKGDTIKQFLFNIKMNRAPNGYHYKQAWYNHFFKEITLEIGGNNILKLNSTILQMGHLIRGESNVDELTFNYSTVEERMEKSSIAHEVIVEPFKLSEMIHSGNIRLTSLGRNEVKLIIETSSLIDILEPDDPNVKPDILEQHDNFINSFEFNGLYQYLDTEPRRRMAREYYQDVIKHHTYNLEEVSTDRNIRLLLNQENVCSAMYIWVTDRNNREIPNQLISNIRIKLNAHERHNLSGFHCRHINKNSMPHPTILNNISQNLYYISYFTGRNNNNGAENGINLSRIDNYRFEIDWVNNIPFDVNIHLVHRTQNILGYTGDMGGLQYEANFNFNIRNQGQAMIQAASQPAVQQPIADLNFTNTEQAINILNTEICMLTHDNFAEGTEVDFCNTCKKAFTKPRY